MRVSRAKLTDVERYRIKRPTSAHAVLGRIMRLVKEDPKRMHMSTVLDPAGDWLRNKPVCGTVGCIAGWTEYIIGYDTDRRSAMTLGDVARRLAPNSWSRRHELYNAFTSGEPFDELDGSQEQADKVVAFLRRFRKKHRAALLKTVVKPVPKRAPAIV